MSQTHEGRTEIAHDRYNLTLKGLQRRRPGEVSSREKKKTHDHTTKQHAGEAYSLGQLIVLFLLRLLIDRRGLWPVDHLGLGQFDRWRLLFVRHLSCCLDFVVRDWLRAGALPLLAVYVALGPAGRLLLLALRPGPFVQRPEHGRLGGNAQTRGVAVRHVHLQAQTAQAVGTQTLHVRAGQNARVGARVPFPHLVRIVSERPELQLLALWNSVQLFSRHWKRLVALKPAPPPPLLWNQVLREFSPLVGQRALEVLLRPKLLKDVLGGVAAHLCPEGTDRVQAEIDPISL